MKISREIHDLIQKVKKIQSNKTVRHHLKKYRKCMKSKCNSHTNLVCEQNQCKNEKVNYETAFAKEYSKLK